MLHSTLTAALSLLPLLPLSAQASPTPPTPIRIPLYTRTSPQLTHHLRTRLAPDFPSQASTNASLGLGGAEDDERSLVQREADAVLASGAWQASLARQRLRILLLRTTDPVIRAQAMAELEELDEQERESESERRKRDVTVPLLNYAFDSQSCPFLSL